MKIYEIDTLEFGYSKYYASISTVIIGPFVPTKLVGKVFTQRMFVESSNF